MSPAVIAPQGFVLGDGTTATNVARDRWRRWRWIAVVGVAVAIGITAITLLSSDTDSTPYGPHNPGPQGSMAAAEILRDHGVHITEVTTLRDAYLALDDDATLVIGSFVFLEGAQVASIEEYAGHTVWLEPDWSTLEWIRPELSVVTSSPGGVIEAGCPVADALRAGSVAPDASRVGLSQTPPGWTMCFTEDSGRSGVLAHHERAGAAPVDILGDASVTTNAALSQAGNAALTFGLLGASDKLVWYSGAAFDDTLLAGKQPGGSYYTPTAPAWLAAAGIGAVLAALVAALWQGRRFGALASEPLPLLVKATEATRGRARLYRRGGARAHATAAMRASAATRIASALGLPRSTTRTEMIAAVAAATGRDGAELYDLIYGRAPATDQAMVDLVRRLDILEDEVRPQ